MSLPATESIKKLKDGSDFLLDEEIRHLSTMNDDIFIHLVRLSDIVKPVFTEVYPLQNASNSEYQTDFSLFPNVFSGDVRVFHQKFQNVSIFPHELENVAILVNQLNVTYSTKDFSNVLYKANFKMYNVSLSSNVNENFIEVIQEYAQERSKYIDINEDILARLKSSFREKLHSVLVRDFIINQRNVAIYITDFGDEVNTVIEELFRGFQPPYFASQSVVFIHKPGEVDYNTLIKTIANPSEEICFSTMFNTSN
mmetsp:Transcript_13215/g.15303  ORF Transcript_13215/g.15303 Transcript_13215/m.15303 type:complete len:254 (+) Transcript_13215:141-902(+)